MILTDEHDLVMNPERGNDARIEFYPHDFTEDEPSHPLIVSHAIDVSDPDARATYRYVFSAPNSYAYYLNRDCHLKNEMIAMGIVKKDSDDNNLELAPEYHVLKVSAHTHEKDSRDSKGYFFYKEKINLVIGDLPVVMSTADVALIIGRGDICTLLTRKPGELSYDVLVFDVAHPSW